MSEHTPSPQAHRTAMTVAMLFVVLLSLAGCGKRPGAVDAPPDVEEDHYPRVYPDISQDPKP